MTTRTALWLLPVLPVLATTAACDRLSRDRKPARIAVADAPAHEKEDALVLDGATVAFEKGGAYDRVCTSFEKSPGRNQPGCIDHHFYVFPAVASSWKPAEPVPAWVTCSGKEVTTFEACRARMKDHAGAIGGSVAVRVPAKDTGGSTSGWEKAIADAVAKHGLTAAPRGPVLRLGD